jgi:hypothetical protein
MEAVVIVCAFVLGLAAGAHIHNLFKVQEADELLEQAGALLRSAQAIYDRAREDADAMLGYGDPFEVYAGSDKAPWN